MSATRTDVDTATDRQAERIVRSAPAEHRFRAATVDEALAQVRASLGEDAEIVEANRIRRGGIGGFFATELGVEVVARGANGDGADVFEPFDESRFTMPNPPPARVASAPPVPRAWTVDNGVAPAVAEPTMPAARARQAWRDATRPAASGPDRLPIFDESVPDQPVTDHPVTDRPVTDQLVTDQLVTDQPVGPPVMSDEAPRPTTFAEHFLRELVQDAEQLRRATDRNRMLPVRAAGAGTAATEPIGRQEPLAGTPIARASEPAVPDRAASTGAQTLPGMPAPTPKRRAKRSGSGATESTTARRVDAAAAASPAPDVAASPARAMIGVLIDQCIALTSAPDASAAPSKLALALTLPDGSVMKVSIERPRRSGRDAAGA
jgi:hypothetical protein